MLGLSEYLLYSVHSNPESGLIGLIVSFLESIEHLHDLDSNNFLVELLPGIAKLENLHPIFVHFPIAFLIGFFGIEFISALLKNTQLQKVASLFLYLGTLSAAVTVIAGLLAASSVIHTETVHDIMEIHQSLGISILVLACLLSINRILNKNAYKYNPNFVFLFFAGILVLLLIFAAYLGGLMVYQYGVATAINRSQNFENYQSHQQDHNH